MARGALQILPILLGNMLAVLVSALVSCVLVSFFRGETILFTTPSQLLLFISGVISPILGILGGIGILLWAQRKRNFDQRELAVLFSLVYFAIAYYYGLVGIPQFTVVS